ncbi:L-type lectin-domain containing receptor kinase IX.1-like [Ipomoea triloba]|uniref:L-type lectin-domain containing receptor kinase IX.1-like n=1 Tax=Ipomoea triloba TaxID=35885 RepID=UPI00125E41A5|nr:L-type lectin-domain containing receptor kinase IX.1-like [Ipomoea triloba]
MAAALCRFLDVLAFLFLLLPSLVCSLSFDLPSIGPKDKDVLIKVEGNATITNRGIKLTPDLNGKAGRAKYVELLHLWDKASGDLADFTTHFTFNIDSNGSSRYADGMAFFMANFSTPFDINRTCGGALGLMDAYKPSPDHFLAVVFDTYSNEKNMPMTNVSIIINSVLVPEENTVWWNNITQGKNNNASITYNATSRILQVVFTGFWDGQYLTGNLSHMVDLRYLPEFVNVGFSGATGMLSEENIVSSWRFNSTSLTLSSSVSSVSPSPSPSPAPPREEKNKKKGLVIGLSICVPVLVALLLALAIVTCLKKTGTEIGNNQEIILLGQDMDSEFQMVSSGPKKFSYTELETATYNFAEEQKLGEVGFGGVYRGFLSSLNLYVAVKRISSGSKQGVNEYASEVKIISRLRHRNLVPLHGWCHEKGELLLVYEYMPCKLQSLIKNVRQVQELGTYKPHLFFFLKLLLQSDLSHFRGRNMPEGSLDSHLFKRNSPLNWEIRYRIAQGLASALCYLHEEWEKCVLHRDIKPSNVLLDSSFNAKLGDFGLAWLVDHENAPQKTIVGGTPGYVVPECNFTFKTSKESDVYSFGIVALGIATGQRAILANDPEGVKTLVEWVWDLYGMGKLLEAVDPKLCGNFDEQEMEQLMMIGLWCAHPDSTCRPKISQALHCLKFLVQLPILPPKMPKPFNVSSSHWQIFEGHTRSSNNTCPSRFTSSSIMDTGSSSSASHSHAH